MSTGFLAIAPPRLHRTARALSCSTHCVRPGEHTRKRKQARTQPAQLRRNTCAHMRSGPPRVCSSSTTSSIQTGLPRARARSPTSASPPRRARRPQHQHQHPHPHPHQHHLPYLSTRLAALPLNAARLSGCFAQLVGWDRKPQSEWPQARIMRFYLDVARFRVYCTIGRASHRGAWSTAQSLVPIVCAAHDSVDRASSVCRASRPPRPAPPRAAPRCGGQARRCRPFTGRT